MRILILGAFQSELDDIIQLFPDLKEITIFKRRCLVSKLNDNDIAISLTGIGTTSAACTTTALCEGFNPDLILMCGMAGGLKANQQIGDLVLAKTIIDADLYPLQTILTGSPYEQCLTDPHTMKSILSEYEIHPLLVKIGLSLPVERLKSGAIITSNVFPAPKNLFSENQELVYSAVEMEGAGVLKASGHYDIPTLIIRAISNLIDTSGADLGTASNAIKICSARLAVFLNNFLEHTSELKEIPTQNQQKRIVDVIEKYNLVQHPEGGWYKRTFVSEDLVKAEGHALTRYDGQSRLAGTSIIYMLSREDFSAWHTVQSDETWNFHAGDPLLLRVVDRISGELNEVLLGVTEGRLQFTVKAGHIFSAETLGEFSLTGCMVTPGFDFKDFNLITPIEFQTNYPQHANLLYLAREKTVVDKNVAEQEINRTNNRFFELSKTFEIATKSNQLSLRLQ